MQFFLNLATINYRFMYATMRHMTIIKQSRSIETDEKPGSISKVSIGSKLTAKPSQSTRMEGILAAVMGERAEDGSSDSNTASGESMR